MAVSPQFTLLSAQRRARSLTISWRADTSCAGQLARLSRHDEVVFVETFNFLGLPGHLSPAPSKADVGMMALDLGQVADLDNEVQRSLKFLKVKLRSIRRASSTSVQPGACSRYR